MFAGNPDTVVRQIKEFRQRVGGIGQPHHDDPAGPGDPRRGREELQASRPRGAAAAAGSAADRRGRDSLGGTAGGGQMSMREICRPGPMELEVLPGAPHEPARRHCCSSWDSIPSARRRRSSTSSRARRDRRTVPPRLRPIAADRRTSDTIYDLVHTYLGVLDAMAAPRGNCSLASRFGGWIAAEVACRRSSEAREAGARRSLRHQARRAARIAISRISSIPTRPSSTAAPGTNRRAARRAVTASAGICHRRRDDRR